MTTTKRAKQGRKAGLKTNARSLAGVSTCRCMNCLLAKISPEDIAKSWIALKDCVKGATHRITSVRWVNGTTFKEDCLVDVIAYTTPGGFALDFTVGDTSILSGARKPQFRVALHVEEKQP